MKLQVLKSTYYKFILYFGLGLNKIMSLDKRNNSSICNKFGRLEQLGLEHFKEIRLKYQRDTYETGW